MAVTGSAGTTPDVVTLAADPGFTADAYQDSFLEVVSGTGAGQFKPIRSHVGVSFPCAGTFFPVLDGTSFVEIRKPAASINIVDDRPMLKCQKHTDENGIEFRTVDMTATRQLLFHDTVVFSTQGTRWLNIRTLTFDNSEFHFGTTVVTKDTGGSTLLTFFGGLFRTAIGSSAPLLMRTSLSGKTGVAILSHARTGRAGGAFVFGGHQFDGAAAGAYTTILLVRDPLSFVEWQNGSGVVSQSDGNALTALTIKNGAQFAPRPGDLALLNSDFNGATQDILIDGVAKSWNDIDLTADKFFRGVKGSTVFESLD